MPAAAIVFDLAPQLVLARNAARAGRLVDPAIVARHLRQLRALLDRGSIEAEGFGRVYLLRDPAEVDAVTILRG
jgi:predicted kinase